MKSKKVVLPAFALMLCAGLAACTPSNAGTESDKTSASASAAVPSSSVMEKISITQAESKKTMVMEETLQLTSSVTGVTWTTSDAKIATVDANGLVTAVGAGDVTITAKKEGYRNGTYSITVTRPAALATLHFEQALHYSADGWWASSSYGSERGPGATPIYSKSTASDGTCVAYFGAGDKETLTFSSTEAIKAELVITMGSSSSVEDLSTVMSITLNTHAVSLAGVGYESDGAGSGDYSFIGVSLGSLDLIKGDNVLEISMLASAPYLDDLCIYSKQSSTIAVKASNMETITLTGVPEDNTLTVEEEKTLQLTCATQGVEYVTSNEAVAIVSSTGLITGVAKGSANITVKKNGMYSARVKVNVTEKLVAGEIKIEAESGVGEGSDITVRNTSTGETITNAWPVDSVLTLTFQAAEVKNMKLVMVARAAASGFNTVDIDLSTDIEVKFNDAKLTLSGTVSGRDFIDYELGTVATKVGNNTIAVTNKVNAPGIDFFKLVPIA